MNQNWDFLCEKVYNWKQINANAMNFGKSVILYSMINCDDKFVCFAAELRERLILETTIKTGKIGSHTVPDC